MFLIIKYADLVQPGHGMPSEHDSDGRTVLHESREDAEAALRAEYPGKTLSDIFVHAQKRVERSRAG